MSPEDRNQLGPTLSRATSTLKTALGEACSADLDRADTGELIRIEEVLAIANEAAKEAVSVRRRLKTTRTSGGTTLAAVAPEVPTSREVEDEHGVRWAVFAVHPSNPAGIASLRERFREGWLSFDSGKETRRIAPIPAGWSELADADLLGLCARAEAAPRRTQRPGPSDSGPVSAGP